MASTLSKIKRKSRKRPLGLKGDKGYDSERLREELRRRHVKPILYRRRKPKRYGGLWPMERTHSWMNQYRRLKMRHGRLMAIHQAFINLACALICHNRARKRRANFETCS